MSFLSEKLIIDKYLRPLAKGNNISFDLYDDAAIMPTISKQEQIIATKDALTVGIHMLEDDSPYDMARKALRVNLSDLASMGSKPIGFLLALCLGDKTDEEFIKNFIRGLEKDIRFYDIPLMGGDIIRQSGLFTVTITAFGSVRNNRILKRSNAKKNDSIWVTGNIGDSALGLKVLRKGLSFLPFSQKQYLIKRYRLPEPRITFASEMYKFSNTCIDISDGILSDISKLASTSKLKCNINITSIPLSKAVNLAVKNDKSFYNQILNGGDDYELAFSSGSENDDLITDIGNEMGIKTTKIGYFSDGEGVELENLPDSLSRFPISGYKHT